MAEIFTGAFPLQLIKIEAFNACDYESEKKYKKDYLKQLIEQSVLDKKKHSDPEQTVVGIPLTQAMILSCIFGYEEVRRYYTSMKYEFKVPAQFDFWLKSGKDNRFRQFIDQGDCKLFSVTDAVLGIIKGCLDLNPLKRRSAAQVYSEIDSLLSKLPKFNKN